MGSRVQYIMIFQMFTLVGIRVIQLITIQANEEKSLYSSILEVEEPMTWQNGRERCQSKGSTLIYVYPYLRSRMQQKFAAENCECNNTFWTVHQVSNKTVVKTQRYYDILPLDNMKEDSAFLLCVVLVYEDVNKTFGWEAHECNDSNIRHRLMCDIELEQVNKKMLTLYIANVTWTDANDFCEETNSSLMSENTESSYLEVLYLLTKGLWSNAGINTFWTKYRTSGDIWSDSPLQINGSSIIAELGENDLCVNCSRSFVCEKDTDEFYYKQFDNMRPVGPGINKVFEVEPTSLANCLLKCKECSEIGIPCEMFAWNKLNHTCQLFSIDMLVDELHEDDAFTTYERFFHTPKIVEDYPFGDEKTTMETNGPWRTTINVKTTEDANPRGANKPLSMPNTEGHIYQFVSVVVATAASSVGMLVFVKYLKMTVKKIQRPKEECIIHTIYEIKKEEIECMPDIFDDDYFPKTNVYNYPPMCHIDLIE